MNTKDVSAEDLRRLLNPAWHHLYNESNAVVEVIPAESLLCPSRFDLAAKLPLARAMRLDRGRDHAIELYAAHLSAWSERTFVESDNSGKVGIHAYLDTFKRLHAEMTKDGFDRTKSVLPVSHSYVLRDGSHRAAAAIDLGLEVPVVRSRSKSTDWDYRFFRGLGLRDKYLDQMALEYSENVQDCYVAYLFPTESRNDQAVMDLIRDIGQVYYERSLDLTRNGVHNLVTQIYQGEPWLGTPKDAFAGALPHVERRYAPGESIRCIFFQASNLSDVLKMKQAVRDKYQQGNYPIHITDSAEEVVRVARQVLSETGVHFLNFGKPYHYHKVFKRLERLREQLLKRHLTPDDYLIDGSAVLALYGLRNAQDVDYLHRGEELSDLPAVYQSHNSELARYPHDLEQLLCSPEHYFYFNELKFLSLTALEEMKRARGEQKDLDDLTLIAGLHKPERILSRLSTEAKFLMRRVPHQAQKLRRHAFLALPERFRPIAKRIYRRAFRRGAQR